MLDLTPARLLLGVLALLAARWLLRKILYRSPLRDLPGPKPTSWATGNLMQLFNRKGLKFHHELVRMYGRVVKVYGFFGDEQLYISDPRALHGILIKEADAYDETSVFLDSNRVVFGQGLVSTKGDQHKRQRKITNPVFAVPQLKQRTPVFYEIAEKLADVIDQRIKDQTLTPASADQDGKGVMGPGAEGGAAKIDIAEWMARVALETVGRTVLGYSFDPLDSPHNNAYTAAVRGIIPAMFSLSLVRQFAPFLTNLGPPSLRRKAVELVPWAVVQRIKRMSDVMHDTAKGILYAKIAEAKGTTGDMAEGEGGGGERGKGRDFISILLRENERAAEGDKLSEDELIGQMTVLIFGAQDTTASALSRMLYMLSRNPDVQERVHREYAAAARDGEGRVAYDEILALPWLDAVVKETLRLYPPVPFVRRSALQTRTLPLSYPIPPSPSSSPSPPSTALTIPAGTTLFLGLAAANRDPEIWGADAGVWRPGRWVEGKDKEDGIGKGGRERLPGIYAGMMTFLSGQRACIGYKFAQIEMKILLATLLARFTFRPTGDEVLWNLSQIISPSVRVPRKNDGGGEGAEEVQGLPLMVAPRAR